MLEESVVAEIKRTLSPLGLHVVEVLSISIEKEPLSFDAIFRFDTDQFISYAGLKGETIENDLQLYKIHNRVQTKKANEKYESVIIYYNADYPDKMIVYLVNKQLGLDMTYDRLDYEKILDSLGYEKELAEIKLSGLFDEFQSRRVYREAVVAMNNDVADFSHKIETKLFEEITMVLTEENDWGVLK